jgi:hypothetical protein
VALVSLLPTMLLVPAALPTLLTWSLTVSLLLRFYPSVHLITATRALTGGSATDPDMTVEKCVALAAGFQYAGVEFST